MFSPNAQEFSKLVEFTFIAGLNQNNIRKYINLGDSSALKADCLLSFPSDSEELTSGILDVFNLI
jgi:hypothetical protein